MAKGYTKINNQLFDELMKADLSGHDFRVLLLIIRNTICYKKQYNDISVSYISNGTGISQREVKRIIKRLADKKYIEIKQKAIGSHPQKIKILGDILCQAWGHFMSNRGDKNDTSRGDKNDTQEIKEIKDKKIKEKKGATAHFFPTSETENEVTEEEREVWWNSLGEDEENV